MIVSLIILGAIVGVGLLLYLLDRGCSKDNADTADAPDASELSADDNAVASPSVAEETEACCGMHLSCEKDSLLADVSDRIEYFDDEELDRFAGRAPESYTPQETEEFRDVLMTLLPTDISPWARSIQLRGIHLPPEIREELLFLVSENRLKG